MAPPTNWKHKARLVPCIDCRTPLVRKTRFSVARCVPCQNKRGYLYVAGKMLRMRSESRRYRIILHVLGWEDDQFEEMLEEMKKSPMMFRDVPETRAARYDLKLERRAG